MARSVSQTRCKMLIYPLVMATSSMTLPGADSSRGSQIQRFIHVHPMITQPGYD